MNTLTVRQPEKPVVVHKPGEGEYFRAANTGSVYILTEVSDKWVAINIRSGRMWDFPEDTAEAAVNGLTYLGPVDITIETK